MQEPNNKRLRKNSGINQMAAILGQQMLSLASNTIKMAAAAISVHDQSSWWSSSDHGSTVAAPLRQFREYTLDEVSWHWEASDCWIVLYDKVYDFTDFLKEHPGGYEVLLEHAGRDATIAFRGANHSKAALRAMPDYLIGILVPGERMYPEDLDSSL